MVNSIVSKSEGIEVLDFYRRNSEKDENYIWWSYQKTSSSFISRGVNVYNRGFIYVPKDNTTDYYSYTTSNLIWVLDKSLAEEDLANLFITFNNNVPEMSSSKIEIGYFFQSGFVPKEAQYPDSLLPWYIWTILALVFVAFAVWFIYLFVRYLKQEDTDIVDYLDVTNNNKVGIETFNANNGDDDDDDDLEEEK